LIKYNIPTIKWCEICGTMKIVLPYKLQYFKHDYCSHKCQSIGFIGIKLSEETKRLISLHNKSGTLEVKEKFRLAKLGKKHTEEHKRKVGLTTKEHWKDPIYRQKVINRMKGHTVSNETRRLISESRLGDKHWTKRLPYPKSAVIKLREARLHQIFPKKDTKLEKMVQTALTLSEIKFRKHEPVIGQPDIFIEPNICIFVDGCYFHGCTQCYGESIFEQKIPKVSLSRDQKVNNELTLKGYIVIRIWEHDILQRQEKAINIINMIKNRIESANRRAEI